MLQLKVIKKSPPELEIIKVIKSQAKVKEYVGFFKYRDKDTRQIVVCVPSLELSGYGATEKKAQEMLKFSIQDYCNYLLDLPQHKLEAELSKLGWSHNKIKQKEYSKSFIDANGQLKNFNAVGDHVETGVLSAA